MSQINQLINELCPNGVVFKKLRELAEIGTGSSNGNEAEDGGVYPFFIRSQSVKSKNTFEYNEEAIIIPGEGGIGDIFHYVNGKYALHQRVYRIHFRVEGINVKFIYHYMRACFKAFILKTAVSATVTSIRKPLIEEFQVPFPPLIVQEEIVRILDGFTELEAELEAELDAELEARKKQYEHYRDTLLNLSKPTGCKRIDQLIEELCPNGVEFKKIAEIKTDIYRGSGIKRSQVCENGIPCVRYGEIYTSYGTWFSQCKSHTHLSEIQNPKYFSYGDILFAITGESVEEIAKSCAYIGKQKCLAGGDIVVLKHSQNPKYLAYALETTNARKQKSAGKVKSKVVHSSVPSIEQIVVPIPPLLIQDEIVAILDHFNELSNDISEGLPAEIEARRKQYEYYRDKLLTFKELEA